MQVGRPHRLGAGHARQGKAKARAGRTRFADEGECERVRARVSVIVGVKQRQDHQKRLQKQPPGMMGSKRVAWVAWRGILYGYDAGGRQVIWTRIGAVCTSGKADERMISNGWSVLEVVLGCTEKASARVGQGQQTAAPDRREWYEWWGWWCRRRRAEGGGIGGADVSVVVTVMVMLLVLLSLSLCWHGHVRCSLCSVTQDEVVLSMQGKGPRVVVGRLQRVSMTSTKVIRWLTSPRPRPRPSLTVRCPSRPAAELVDAPSAQLLRAHAPRAGPRRAGVGLMTRRRRDGLGPADY